MDPSVLLDHQNDGISRITINRPPLNLLDDETLDSLLQAFREVDQRDATRAVVFSGSGNRAFSGGHQLTRSEGTEGRPPSAEQRSPGGVGRQVAEQIETLTKPVVCAAKGWVVGGAISFVLASDIRIAADTVRFRYVDVFMGMAPAWGLTLARLVHYIGRNRALDFLLMEGDVGGLEAFAMGLVTRSLPEEEVDEEVNRVAGQLAKGAPLTIQCIKECTRTQYTNSFEEAKRVQDDWIRRISGSKDSKEGTRAWFEKRPPVFEGV